MAAMESYQKSEEGSSDTTTTKHYVKLLSGGAICTVLVLLSGISLAGTFIALIVATPLLVLFSPILIPAGIFVLLEATGFVTSVVGVIWAVSWLLKYASPENKYGTQRVLDLGKYLLRRYLEIRFGWIVWLWSMWGWLQQFR